MKKAQSSVELLIIVSALLFFFTLFFVSIQMQTAQKNSENNEKRMREILLNVKNEIFLASESVDGYQRTFEIPPTISALEYDIMIVQNRTIYAVTNDNKIAVSYPIISVSGELQKGSNMIRKINGTININQ